MISLDKAPDGGFIRLTLQQRHTYWDSCRNQKPYTPRNKVFRDCCLNSLTSFAEGTGLVVLKIIGSFCLGSDREDLVETWSYDFTHAHLLGISKISIIFGALGIASQRLAETFRYKSFIHYFKWASGGLFALLFLPLSLGIFVSLLFLWLSWIFRPKRL